jgi:hypothetical protein
MMMVALNGSIESAGVMDDNEVPEIEVPPKATRRRFPAEYKARILAEYERLPDGDTEQGRRHAYHRAA